MGARKRVCARGVSGCARARAGEQGHGGAQEGVCEGSELCASMC